MNRTENAFDSLEEKTNQSSFCILSGSNIRTVTHYSFIDI